MRTPPLYPIIWSCDEFNYRESEDLWLKICFFTIVNKINSFIIHLKRYKYKYKSLEYIFYMHNKKNSTFVYSPKCANLQLRDFFL